MIPWWWSKLLRSWAYPWRFTDLETIARRYRVGPRDTLSPPFFPFLASMSNILLMEPSPHRLTVAITSIESKYGVHGDNPTSYLPLVSTSVFLMFHQYAYEETKEERREHLKLMERLMAVKTIRKSDQVFLFFKMKLNFWGIQSISKVWKQDLKHVNAIRHWKHRPPRSYCDVQIFIYAFLHITKPIQTYCKPWTITDRQVYHTDSLTRRTEY